MKDFQVAPIKADDPIDAASPMSVDQLYPNTIVNVGSLMKPTQPQQAPLPPPPANERGIARFRRIAKQVVDQTASHRWDVAVRGVRDSQIGRCNSRQSFRNQQNLRRAIQEAKR